MGLVYQAKSAGSPACTQRILKKRRLCDKHLFVCSHDEVSPFLHRPGGADLSVGDVGGDEAQQALQKDL